MSKKQQYILALENFEKATKFQSGIDFQEKSLEELKDYISTLQRGMIGKAEKMVLMSSLNSVVRI